VIAVGGGTSDEAELKLLFDGLETMVQGSVSLEESMANPLPILAQATERALKQFRQKR
jgi:hypothetical protein